jgi:penicillin-binding protein 1A
LVYGDGSNLVTGVWVVMKIVQPFQSITYGQGATAALPVWAYFMKLCYADENLKVSKESLKTFDL